MQKQFTKKQTRKKLLAQKRNTPQYVVVCAHFFPLSVTDKFQTLIKPTKLCLSLNPAFNSFNAKKTEYSPAFGKQ